jgi:hypothetical protein
MVFSLSYIMLPIGAKGHMCCTLTCANSSGARQCEERHKQFAALHKFPPTLPKIWVQVAEKRFLRNQWCCPLKKKKIKKINIQHLNAKELVID